MWDTEDGVSDYLGGGEVDLSGLVECAGAPMAAVVEVTDKQGVPTGACILLRWNARADAQAGAVAVA